MTGETNIECLFNAVRLGEKENAKIYAEKAQEEVDRLAKMTHIRDSGKESLTFLNKFIKNALNGEIRSAQEYLKYDKMIDGYNGHLKQYLKMVENPLKTYEKSTPTNPITPGGKINGGKREQQIDRNTSPEKKQNSSQFANLKPTDVAVKFTKLYDKEWAAAYDDLYNNRKLKETTVIATLLKIVQDAFGFCTKESEKQIKDMYDCVCSLLKNGTTESQKNGEPDKPSPKATDIAVLKEFRKIHALLTISCLQNTFLDTFMRDVCLKELNGIHLQDASEIVNYAKKAIKVTWMMTVLDQPVFMCPTTREDFDKNMYSAFVKNGKQLDYFVWPALKLGRNGRILTTGKVQFK